MIRRKVIALALGAKIERLGSGRLERGELFLEAGCIGEVVEIKAPVDGTGRSYQLDDGGEPIIDRGRDGYAIVDWPSWGRTALHAEDEGRTWRRH